KRKTARPGWEGGRYTWMRYLLATETGHQLYRKRQVTVEPVFGQTVFNRKLTRFHRRGHAAVHSEWRLVTATHNLLKLHSPRSDEAVGFRGSVRGVSDHSWMAQNFIACDRGQVMLLPPSLTDWLAEDHLVCTVIGAVEQMDLAAFYGAYRANGQGRAAYDPRV